MPESSLPLTALSSFGYDRNATVGKIAELLSVLVASETARDREEATGLRRRDGGRMMCEISMAGRIVDAVFCEVSKDTYALSKELEATTAALIAERKKSADLQWRIDVLNDED